MNIWSLGDDFIKNPWFTEVSDYVETRYDSLTNRFSRTLHFVTPNKENSNVFSYEFASILRDTGSVFDSSIKRIILMAELDYKTNIHGYLQFLRKYEPQLSYIRVTFLHYGGQIYPFRPTEKSEIPAWWNAYNCIKHEEVTHMDQGNFRNALQGLAALGILKQSMGRSRELNIFKIPSYPFYKTQTEYYLEFFEYPQFYEKGYYNKPKTNQ